MACEVSAAAVAGGLPVPPPPAQSCPGTWAWRGRLQTRVDRSVRKTLEPWNERGHPDVATGTQEELGARGEEHPGNLPPPPWLPSGEVRGWAGLRHCSVLASFLSSAEPFCTRCPHV